MGTEAQKKIDRLGRIKERLIAGNIHLWAGVGWAVSNEARQIIPSHENSEPHATSIIWMEFEMGPIEAFGKETAL